MASHEFLYLDTNFRRDAESTFFATLPHGEKCDNTAYFWLMGTEDQNNTAQPSNIIHIETMFRDTMMAPVVTQALEKRVAKFLTEAALEQFPVLQNMSSEQIRAFGRLILNTADDFSFKAEEIANALTDEKKPV